MRWVRLYNETTMDPKWRLVAADSGQPVFAVLAVWAAMLCHASGIEPRGTLLGWSDRLIGAALDLPAAAVAAIRAAMQGVTLDGDRLSAWDKRQFKSDHSGAERMRDHRARKTAAGEPGKAASPAVTSRPLRATDSRIQITERQESPQSPPPPDDPPLDRSSLAADFAEWYGRYPHRVGRPAAERAYRAARKRGATREDLLAGAIRYRERLAHPEAPRPCNPATWLAQERWTDEPMPPVPDSRIKACGRSPEPATMGAYPPSRAAIEAILAERCPRLHPMRIRDFAQQLDQWFSRGRLGWNSFWGDPPDSPDCEIPATAIAAVRAQLGASVEGRA
ncbi:hypothetical protein J2847_002664 [Azospirillum agricola]|uniref:hypothetical protein n=1 Tax=Azospirillum agricola TaxID=1720247 RepID=UPI001AE95BAA|nr:hypothetical protein [Azospirillum agricola]MBP2229370.1 hypothetical protein [Azospirillum agricola]